MFLAGNLVSSLTSLLKQERENHSGYQEKGHFGSLENICLGASGRENLGGGRRSEGGLKPQGTSRHRPTSFLIKQLVSDHSSLVAYGNLPAGSPLKKLPVLPFSELLC